MKTLFLCLIFTLSLTLCKESFAQCCAAGNPVSTNCSVSQGGKDILQVSLSYIYSMSITYYNGTEKLDKQYMDTYFNFSSLALSYGITNNIRLTTDIGYFLNKSQNFLLSNYTRYAQGISDLTVGLVYNSYKSDDKLFEISQSARMTVPVGKFNQEFDGVVLPIDLQPSSGNYKYNLGLSFSKRFENSKFSLQSFNSLEISQMIEAENSFHKYGNLYNLSLMGIYSISTNFTGMLQLRSEIREKALDGSKSQDNVYSFINSTGGTVIFISPQITYNINNDLHFALQYNQPFYKKVYGEQLTNNYSVFASISKSLDFSGEQSATFPNANDTALSKTQINVKGNCDMCKARIEKVVREFKNVSGADWNKTSKVLTISYKTNLPDLDGIEKSLADAGHDTDKYKADDETYSKLPNCCLYRGK